MQAPQESNDNDACTVIRAGQRPALLLWVPLMVAFGEIFIFLYAVYFFNFWAAALLPIHFIFMALTERDPFWPRVLWISLNHYYFRSNKGLRGKTALTFNAAPVNSHLRDYEEYK